MGDRDLFSLFIHHGGYLADYEGLLCYMKGHCLEVFYLRQSTFNLLKLFKLLKSIGYASWTKIWYKLPRTHDFRLIKSEDEVKKMMNILGPNISSVRVYIEGGVDDKSGNLEKNKNLDEVESHLLVDGWNEPDSIVNEGVEREPVLDLGVVERANVDGLDEIIDRVFNDDIVQYADEHVENVEEQVENVEVEDDIDEAGYEQDDDDDDDDDELDDGLDDDDLANGDDEYIEARRRLREGGDEELTRLVQKFVHPPPNEEDEPVSDYADSNGDINSDETDEDDDSVRFNRRRVVYDPKCDHKSLELIIEMRFQDGWECRRALTSHAIENGKFVRFRRVSKVQCEAKCSPPCPWKVYASVVKKDKSFCIKTYMGDHECPRSMNNKLLSSKWIAYRYLNVFRVRPIFTVSDLRQDIVERFGYDLPNDRIYKARSTAKALVRGTVDHHYGLIRRYVAELRRIDRDGRYELLLGDDHVFKGLYLGFSALVNGFKQSCRPWIGLDGCHLKTYLGGVLLCAVAKDGNDQMFPIAWAVVEVENEDCWTWFLKCLIEDIGIGDGNGYTFMSDQQKGLENAVKVLAPYADHRNCARHIYMNWKKSHKGSTLKKIFLNATRSTYPEKYKYWLEEMKKESVDAYQDFRSKDTHKFSKTFFSFSCCSDENDNNISETFNGFILNARGKHVIHMSEEIRSSLMTRQVKKRDEMSRINDRICPNIRKKLEKLRRESSECKAKVALNDKFEVHHFADTFTVSITNRTCSCREWQLSGIPCVHAIASIHYKCEDPAQYVHEYYTVQKYMLAYNYALEPVGGEMMWPEVPGYTVKPPAIRRKTSRPKKKRIRSVGEVNPRNPKKMSLVGMPMNCSNCGCPNHNSRTCRNPRVEKPTKQKGKRGRPAKEKLAGEAGPSTRGGASGVQIGRGGAARGVQIGRGGAASGVQIGRGGAVRGEAARGASAQGRGRGRSAVGSTSHLSRERNFALRGLGLYVSPSTGRSYFHAPGRNNVVYQTQGGSSSSCVVNEGGPASSAHPTQESRN